MREDEKKAGRMDKVSLIMTTFNSIAHLRMTLESVRQQDYPAIEVAVWDGGSTDGTLEVLQEYEKRPDMDLKWRSGRDRGIYDAMNKGFELATGDIVAFFNDVYLCGGDECAEKRWRTCGSGLCRGGQSGAPLEDGTGNAATGLDAGASDSFFAQACL